MVDQPELASLHGGDDQKPTEASANIEDDVATELIENPYENAEDATIREEVDLSGVEDTANEMDQAGNDASHTAQHDYHDTEDGVLSLSQQPEEDDGYVEIPNDADETHGSDHEIDYEFEEQAEQHDSNDELDLDVENNLAPSGTEAAVDNSPEDNVLQSVGDAVTENPEGDFSEHGDYGDNQEQAEQDEITYDEDEGDVPEPVAIKDDETVPGGNLEGAATDTLNDESQAQEEGLSGRDGHFHEQHAEEQTTPQHDDAENVEFDEYDVAAEDQDGQQDAADLEQQDPSVSGENSVAASDTEFPAITVQYKGDEFPCFSITSDGFFTEISIIDATMDKVLLGFRDELASEIAQEEELVFQIDELGLEFSESCLQESLASVTLRQILEIFDLLVKNQDPDSSRTLYTYLFTKPSASKRLESLIESATAGKGLDEVIHIFESPVAAAASVLEANTADDELEERLDEYDSPADDDVEGISKGEMEQDVEYLAGDAPGLDASALNGNQDSNEGDQDATEADYTEDNAVDPTSEDAIATNDQASSAAAIEDDVESNGYVEEHGREEEGFRHALQFRRRLEWQHANSEKPVLRHALRKLHYSNSDFSVTYSATDADQSILAHDESESNPFINPELDDDAEVDDEVDLEVGGLTDEHNPIDPDVANVGTTGTSTTTTLKDDDETGSIIADVIADAAVTGLPDTTEVADEDDVGEIDWRDEPEADGDIPSPPSVVGKRARGDDEADVEDEQDVKRRRP
ncbi:hypothetical protein G7Z17_g8412 [Cylindrodendrum hubeiense]|uniref:Uncharacterized protein n=1 Tax=Cylindrodendrum hubeiense TaxID=595255 RepID=A0A9P5H223_9HYPO|nr:hypothetical protein G7Z17_g8412 [Cylindrodendrum hubeiense]